MTEAWFILIPGRVPEFVRAPFGGAMNFLSEADAWDWIHNNVCEHGYTVIRWSEDNGIEHMS